MKGSYLGDWTCRGDVEADFDVLLTADINILLACYTYENYDGSARVIFEQDGKLYEVYGGHCSCYGLEGQWEPTETNIEALKKYDYSTEYYDNDVWVEYGKQLKNLISQLEPLKFEYWVERTEDDLYPWVLKCALVGEPDMFIGYQLTAQQQRMLIRENYTMGLGYLVYRLTDNLKMIIEKEQAA